MKIKRKDLGLLMNDLNSLEHLRGLKFVEFLNSNRDIILKVMNNDRDYISSIKPDFIDSLHQSEISLSEKYALIENGRIVYDEYNRAKIDPEKYDEFKEELKKLHDSLSEDQKKLIREFFERQTAYLEQEIELPIIKINFNDLPQEINAYEYNIIYDFIVKEKKFN
jgi:hypothetical protein